MAEPAQLTPSLAELLPPWMARQRWYAAKGRQPVLRRVGGIRLQDPAGEVGIETHLVLDTSGEPTVYQVPLTYRASPLAGAQGALVGVAEHSRLGTRHIYDGTHDPAFAEALLSLVLQESTARSEGATGTCEATGHRHPGSAVGSVVSCQVLKGEQSNTSVIIQTADETGAASKPLIAKVFRVLHDGENPDVVVQSALAAAGSDLVPAPVGSVSGAWPDDRTAAGRAAGHLAFVQEFLPGVQDAWRVALKAVEAGADFTARANALGRATAEVHSSLAKTMPTAAATAELVRSTVASLESRLAAAVLEVPALAAHEDAIRFLYRAAADVGWPVLQRIHGDYHLGQVLDVPGRGWVLLDFEGEPMRPLSERALPDLALRDVAGMLRSFDYAAGSFEQAHPGQDASSWAKACRDAFLDGYADVAPGDPRDETVLLPALELDKALYEVVYEARNRPTWLGIPTAAIARLLSAAPRRNSDVTPKKPTEAAKPAVPRAPAARPIAREELDRLVGGWHHAPHSILGPHLHDGALTLRALRPMAARVWADLADGSRVEYVHEYEGVWTAVVASAKVLDYRVHVEYGDGIEHGQDDPYRFLPTLGEIDMHLIREGRHEKLWTALGSHVRSYETEMGTVQGTSFAVWAPNARAIRVVGDFNQWDGQAHPMRSLGSSGVWELFLPGVGAGARYKYEIVGSDGIRRAKADPMARATETPPATASMVTASEYVWSDEEWMTARAQTSVHTLPMTVYEVHIGSWRQGSSYRDLAEHLTNYVKDLGFTHVEFLPVAEHPYGPSWGYQVTGYYAPTSRFGTPDDFRYLVDTLHQNGIGVIVDWVPAHFPKDAFALARFDGQALYEHPDPRRGDQPDWGTHVFDFGRNEVRNFLVANALYWLEEFHVDGLRVDAVASMLYLDYSRKDGEWAPNQYGGREHLEAVQLLQETNATVYKQVPGVVMIAEESTSWPGVTRSTHLGGLGFGLKWNMGWMHDSLSYVQHEPVHRQYHHHEMTFSLVYAWSENFVLPISHDEVVHGKGSLLGKMPGDRWKKLAGLRTFLAHMWAHPGKPLLFMGSEFGQEGEWADSRSLDWWLLDQPAHYGVHALVRTLNEVYAARPALWQLDESWEGFQWIDANDASGNTFSFLRLGQAGESGARPVVAAISNFSGVPHYSYRIGLPHAGRWNEILNTDAEAYGGSGVGNMGSVTAEEVPWHGQPYSAVITVPPLAALWLEPEGSVIEPGPGPAPLAEAAYPPVGDPDEDPAEGAAAAGQERTEGTQRAESTSGGAERTADGAGRTPAGAETSTSGRTP